MRQAAFGITSPRRELKPGAAYRSCLYAAFFIRLEWA